MGTEISETIQSEEPIENEISSAQPESAIEENIIPTTLEKEENNIAESEKRASYEAKLLEVIKVYGKDAITRIDITNPDISSYIKVDARPTGILSVDRATKIGGMPKGRVVEIIGPESSGKTTLVLHTISECQREGGIAAYIDLEFALEGYHMEACGVSELDIFYPTTAEDALNIVGKLIPTTDIIVVDSVSALVPKIEHEKEIGDTQPGRAAFLMSQSLRQFAAPLAKSGCTLVFINQIRQLVGITYGSNETGSGGNALKFYSSMRLDMRRIGKKVMNETIYANDTKVKVIKNKVGVPFGEETFQMYFDASKTIAADIVNLGTKLGIIHRAGAWYSYNGERLGQGGFNTVNYLISNPDLLEDIQDRIRDPDTLFKKVAKSSKDQNFL